MLTLAEDSVTWTQIGILVGLMVLVAGGGFAWAQIVHKLDDCLREIKAIKRHVGMEREDAA